jgi:spoIIIJ-associated protein
MAPNLIQENQLNRKATADALRKFLEEVIRTSKLELKATVHFLAPDATAVEGEPEVAADIDGKDREILLEYGGELLKAIEHLAFRALRLEPAFHEKIHIDCGGYRAMRFEELRMTARVAAERVQSSRQSFRLNPMSPRERRVVHLALKNMPGVRTESIGMGEDRQVVIYPADAKSPR